MNGALPGGDYRLLLRGYQPTMDGRLKIELLYRAQSGGDRLLAQTEMTNQVDNSDGGFPGDLDVLLSAPAVTPACGDALVLRIRFLSGGSPYSNFNPTLVTP